MGSFWGVTSFSWHGTALPWPLSAPASLAMALRWRPQLGRIRPKEPQGYSKKRIPTPAGLVMENQARSRTFLDWQASLNTTVTQDPSLP